MTPARQADGIRRMNRVATIFPLGAWVAREAAGASLARSRVTVFQRNDTGEVNGTLSKNHMFTIHAKLIGITQRGLCKSCETLVTPVRFVEILPWPD